MVSQDCRVGITQPRALEPGISSISFLSVCMSFFLLKPCWYNKMGVMSILTSWSCCEDGWHMQLTCTYVGSLGRQAFYTPKLVPAFWRFKHSKEEKYSLSNNIIIRQIIVRGSMSVGLTDQAESAESSQSWLQTQIPVLQVLCSATQETLSCSIM